MTARVSFVGRARETGAAVGWLLLFTVVGIALTIRGYPLRRLADAIGPGPAVATLGFAAFFSAGGMALAWGLHFGFDVPGIDYLPGAHAWFDGGRFGPEGGLIGTLAVLGGLALVLGGRIRQPRTWLPVVAA